ncbi:MAG: FtsQ-type POTRA domain-containing protein [Caldilineaceae bacterium]|nr:FtsQ-type POTRA domain-containing protein [Caldilineaceae bacterium]
MAPKAAEKRQDTAKYRKARRKRQRARRMRRMEAVLPGNVRVERIALPRIRRPAFSPGAWTGNVRQLAGSGWHWSKLFSLLLFAVAAAAVFRLHWDARWFVSDESIEFVNLGYLERADLAPELSIRDWSIFWLQPDDVREQIMRHPYVADAGVRIRLPNQVTVTVEEVQPTALWVTREGTLWLLDDGTALTMRSRSDAAGGEERTDAEGKPLPQIIDVNRDAQTPGKSAIDPEVLDSALTLLAALPQLQELRFNQGVGLNFALPDGKTYVYWGDGHDIDAKLANLDAGQQLLSRGEAAGTVIDVRYVERPFIQ